MNLLLSFEKESSKENFKLFLIHPDSRDELEMVKFLEYEG